MPPSPGITDQEIADKVLARLTDPPRIYLTPNSLLEAIHRCTYGRIEPTHIICGNLAYDRVVMGLLARAKSGGPLSGTKFMGAEIQLDPHLPVDEIIILNKDHIGIQEFTETLRVL